MNDSEIHDLLAETQWMRRLALRLADQAADADDIVQDTLTEAIDRPPQSRQRFREWLATVMRHRAARHHRQRKRRDARERKVASNEAIEATDDIVARLELQRELTRIVLELPDGLRGALLLRYFEDLPPRLIAARLGIPVETVRTRLRRALSQLRGRLDSRFGDRGTWTGLLLVRFGDVSAVTSTASALGSALDSPVGVFFMQSSRSLVTAILVVFTLAISAFWIAQHAREGDSREQDRVRTATHDARAAAASGPTREPIPGDELLPSRVAGRSRAPATDTEDPVTADIEDAAASAGTAGSPIRGRVIDSAGNPLPGIAVHWAGPNAIRYSDSIETWLGNGGHDSIQWTPELQRRLEEDPSYAESFLSELTDPAEWRATLLGRVGPGRGAVTESDGSFQFSLSPSAPRPGRVIVVQKAMRTLADGLDERDELVLVAVPVVTVAGRVKDRRDTAFAGARLTYRAKFDVRALPIRLREARHSTTTATIADDRGRYILREIGVLPDAEIEVAHESAIPISLSVPALSQGDFDICLDALDAGPRAIRIHGHVVDLGSRRVPSADLFCGSIRSRCDDQGAFEIEVPLGREPRSLIAVAKGHRPAILEAFTATIEGSERDEVEVEIRLPGPSGSIAGRLRDASGSPLAGVSLNLFDPTLPDTSFSSLEMLSAGRREVQSDGEGMFRIEGLEPRSYRLRIWSAERMIAHVSEPIPAGDTGVDLVVPDLPRLAPASGRVRDRSGLPIADALVAFGFTTFQPKHGWEGLHGPVSTTDSEGRFSLDVLPLRHVFLEVRGESLLPLRLPIESVAHPGSLDLVADRACRLVLRDDSTEPSRLRVLDEAGRPQTFVVGDDIVEGLRRDDAMPWPDLAVATTARCLEITGRSDSTWRVALTPDPLRATELDVSPR